MVLPLTFFLISLVYQTLAADPRVCATCYVDDATCTIPAGYNINCAIIDIMKFDGTCWTESVYSFDIPAWIAANGITTVMAGVNLGSASPSNAAVLFEQCLTTINSGNLYGFQFQGMNIDWEPCSGTKTWPTGTFYMDMGGSVTCTLPSNAVREEMVYDGAQLKYQNGQQFDCDKIYMFTSYTGQINIPQSGSEGGITPAMFIAQCPGKPYDVYVTPAQYSNPALTAPCGACTMPSSTPTPTTGPTPTPTPTTGSTPTPTPTTNPTPSGTPTPAPQPQPQPEPLPQPGTEPEPSSGTEPAPEAPPNNSTEPPSNTGAIVGAVVGGVLGGILALLLIIGLLAYLLHVKPIEDI